MNLRQKIHVKNIIGEEILKGKPWSEVRLLEDFAEEVAEILSEWEADKKIQFNEEEEVWEKIKDGEVVVKCTFGKAWIGKCGKDADKSGLCEEHKDIICSSCGAQATRECEETMGLVCGSPLCDDCEHTLCENGCNSGAPLPKGLGSHCKKTEQVYELWIIQDFKEKQNGKKDKDQKE